MTKMMWYTIEPRDAADISLPSHDVQGPYNEEGFPCPWPWDPIQLKGAPLGQYHCPYCGAMCVAGIDHVDYGQRDAYGIDWLSLCFMDDMCIPHPADLDRWASEGGSSWQE